MQTIIITLDAKKMQNPDLDIRYTLPERIEEYTNQQVKDNGYDYLSGTVLGLWLETDDSAHNAEKIIRLIHTEKFSENDLSKSAKIYISDEAGASLKNCRKIYPQKQPISWNKVAKNLLKFAFKAFVIYQLIFLIVLAGVSILYKKPEDISGTHQTKDKSATFVIYPTDPHSFITEAKFYHNGEEECFLIEPEYLELRKISETIAKDGHVVRGEYTADKLPYQFEKNTVISFTFNEQDYILFYTDS
ncbi:MAG: hypothetical protein IJ644_05525 [Oscillospiraceae bacterium]|nr:hypothetical protein [Oscillospiraceae bacterium]